MYAPGHVGIALVLVSPVGFALHRRGRTGLALVGTVTVAGATLLPDADKWLPWFAHRGITHTVWFALVIGITLGAIAASIGYYRYRDGTTAVVFGAFGVVVGTLAVLAHLLGDVVTPMGVRPFFPISDARYTADLVPASDPTANARLLALGCLLTIAQLVSGAGIVPTGWRSALQRSLDGRRHVPAGTDSASPNTDPKPTPTLSDPKPNSALSADRVPKGRQYTTYSRR